MKSLQQRNKSNKISTQGAKNIMTGMELRRFEMNIIREHSDNLFMPVKYYIDCPCDSEMHGPQVKRIEIPRELARYIRNLQEQIKYCKDKS